MAEGKIKKLKVKQLSGIYGDYIPLGADAVNVDLTNGQTVEENIDYINTELLVARDTIDEITATSFTLPIASDVVLGGIKIGNGLSIDEYGVVTATGEGTKDYNDLINKPELAKVAISGDYNDLNNRPNISLPYTLPIATAANLGGIRIGAGLSIDATGVVSVKIESGTMDYNELENKPDLSIYAKSSDLATVAVSGSYNDLNDKPVLATVAISGDYNNLINQPIIPSEYILPTATTEIKGGIKVDGSLLAVNNEILTAPGYLPLTGGLLTGDLRICSEGTSYGNTLSFGDAGYCYLKEASSDVLTIHSLSDIILSKGWKGSEETVTLTQLLGLVGGGSSSDSIQMARGSYIGTGSDTEQTITIGFVPDFLMVLSDHLPEGNGEYADEDVIQVAAFYTGEHSDLYAQGGYQHVIAGDNMDYHSYSWSPDFTVFTAPGTLGYVGNGFKSNWKLNIINGAYYWFAIGREVV